MNSYGNSSVSLQIDLVAIEKKQFHTGPYINICLVLLTHYS